MLWCRCTDALHVRQRLNCTKAQAHSLISLHAFMKIMLEMLLENQSLNSLHYLKSNRITHYPATKVMNNLLLLDTDLKVYKKNFVLHLKEFCLQGHISLISQQVHYNC